MLKKSIVKKDPHQRKIDEICEVLDHAKHYNGQTSKKAQKAVMETAINMAREPIEEFFDGLGPHWYVKD